MHAAYDTPLPHAPDEAACLRQHAPLVARVVRQLTAQAGGVLEREDMEQIGLLALLEALRRYGVPDEGFTGYALLRVRGAILDELRRLDWRPRGVRQQAHRVRDGVRALTRSLGREPSAQEAACHLGISVADYQASVQAEYAEALASFDALLAAGHEPAAEDAALLRLQQRLTLAKALAELDAREQRVVQLYYEFDLSLKEIAAVLGLTEARVCQINKSALKKMQARLAGA